MRWTAGAALLLLAWLVWSVGGALTAPGTDSTSARLAEWARFHRLGWAVSGLEQLQYQLNPPAVGGSPAGGIPSAAAPGPASPAAGSHPRPHSPTDLPSSAAAGPVIAPVPAPIPAQARPALPGEGRWQTLVLVRGEPAVRAAFLRPDSQHTSYLVGVAWMDQHLTRLVLHPGTQVPGGTGWSQPPRIPGAGLGQLLATFNSGFTMVDAEGGYWQGGRQVGRLTPGAGSVVFHRDGRVDVGAWGSDVSLSPDVVAVRQNLVPLVDRGRISPLVADASTRVWGATLGNKDFVWRTALGVRADGSLVFVVGPALSVPTLARIVHDAGAVRAVELDINPEWTDFMTYSHPSPGVAIPHMLTSDEQPNPYRYLQTSTRDFVAVYGR